MLTSTLSQNCLDCGLIHGCKKPLSAQFSNFTKKYLCQNYVLVVADHPDAYDDSVEFYQSPNQGHDVVLDYLECLDTKWIFKTALACYPGEDPKKLKDKNYSLCFKEQVEPLMLKFKPRSIICLGLKAMKAVLGENAPSAMSDIETTGYQIYIDGSPCQVFSLPHCSKFNDEKTNLGKLKQRYGTTFMKAEDYAMKVDGSVAVAFEAITSIQDFSNIEKRVSDVFAFDVENSYSKVDITKNVIHKTAVKLLTLSITWREKDTLEYKNAVIWGNALDDVNTLKRLFKDRICVAHNIKHDAQILRIKRGVNIFKLCRDFHDTMVMFYLADQNRKKNGLKPLAVEYLKVLDWKVKLNGVVLKANTELDLKKKYLKKTIAELKSKTLPLFQKAYEWASQDKPKIKVTSKTKYEACLLSFDSEATILKLIENARLELESLPEKITDEDMEAMDIMAVAEYNAEDTLRTLQLYFEVLPVLGEFSDDPLDKAMANVWDDTAYKLVKRYTAMLAEIEIEGIPLNSKKLLEFDAYLSLNIENIKSELIKRDDIRKSLGEVAQIKNCLDEHLREALMLEKLTPKTQAFILDLASTYDIMKFAKITKGNKLSFGYKELEEAKRHLIESNADLDRIEVLAKLLKLREMLDLRSKTCQSWMKFVCEDGKLHPTFKTVVNQNIGYSSSEESGGAQSGRLSSNDPNSQQFPKDEIYFVRQFMEAPEGYTFVEIDYTSIEPMLIAIVTGCKRLHEIFEEGKDIYLATADDIFELNIDWSQPMSEIKEKYSKIRKIFKVGFLAWCYGQHKKSFAKRCGISDEQTELFYENAKKYYWEIYKWKEDVYAKIDAGEYLLTLSGRKRKFPLYVAKDNSWQERRKENNVRDKARRVGVNFLIQSLGSDITLWMACNIMDWIQDNDLERIIKILNVVHDSIWFCVKKTQLALVKDLKRMMVDSSALFFKTDFKFKLEATKGDNLGESMNPTAWNNYVTKHGKFSFPVASGVST